MIELKSITKKYGKQVVLNSFDLSLELDKNTLLIAPNGYGKSTLLKIIIGAAFPNKGWVELSKNKKYSFVNEVIEYPNIKIRDIVEAEIALLENRELPETYLKLYHKWDLEEFLEKKFRKLSKGMKRKLALSLSLLSDPDYLILDEPFEGLDIISRDILVDILVERKRKGKGSIISTHILFDLSDKIDNAVFINNRKIFEFRDINKWSLRPRTEVAEGVKSINIKPKGEKILIKNKDEAKVEDVVVNTYKYLYDENN